MKDFLIWFFTVVWPIACGVIVLLGLIFIYCEHRATKNQQTGDSE